MTNQNANEDTDDILFPLAQLYLDQECLQGTGEGGLRAYFQILPVAMFERKLWVMRLQTWFHQWSSKPTATQYHSKNSLRAFQKLLDHTQQWMDYTDMMEPMAAESTLRMFLSLLRERFNVYYATATESPSTRSNAPNV